MSVRRKTNNRIWLFRECGTCGQFFRTQADTAFVRQIERDGKKQATTYYCCMSCFHESYIHKGWIDGSYWKRKEERDRQRGYEKERCDRYRAEHRDEINQKARKRYWENREECLANQKYYREKMKRLYPTPVEYERTATPVVGTRIADGEKIWFPSAYAAREKGFKSGAICACIIGRQKTHHGYIWERGETAADGKAEESVPQGL